METFNMLILRLKDKKFKTMKKLVLLLLLPLLTFVMTGCNDNEPQNIVASDICGTWYLTIKPYTYIGYRF